MSTIIPEIDSIVNFHTAEMVEEIARIRPEKVKTKWGRVSGHNDTRLILSSRRDPGSNGSHGERHILIDQ